MRLPSIAGGFVLLGLVLLSACAGVQVADERSQPGQPVPDVLLGTWQVDMAQGTSQAATYDLVLWNTATGSQMVMRPQPGGRTDFDTVGSLVLLQGDAVDGVVLGFVRVPSDAKTDPIAFLMRYHRNADASVTWSLWDEVMDVVGAVPGLRFRAPAGASQHMLTKDACPILDDAMISVFPMLVFPPAFT